MKIFQRKTFILIQIGLIVLYIFFNFFIVELLVSLNFLPTLPSTCPKGYHCNETTSGELIRYFGNLVLIGVFFFYTIVYTFHQIIFFIKNFKSEQTGLKKLMSMVEIIILITTTFFFVNLFI